MTKSPIPALKDAVRELRDVYNRKEVTTEELHEAFIRATGSYRRPTLAEYMRLLERFKIIKSQHREDGRLILGVWTLPPESEWTL